MVDFISAIKEFTLGPDFFRNELKEKRLVPRIECNIMANAYISDKIIPMEITDLSLNGLKIVSRKKLSLNQRFGLQVEILSGELTYGDIISDRLNVRVAWCRKLPNEENYNAGLIIDEDEGKIKNSWVFYIFSEFGMGNFSNSQKRNTFRLSKELQIICKTMDLYEINCIIENIGLGGLLVTTDEKLANGTKLDILLGPYKNFKKLYLEGAIVRTEFLEESKQWISAIEFKDIDPRKFKILGKLILALSKEASKE